MARKTQAELVQEQILNAGRNIGRVRKTPPLVSTVSRDINTLPPNESIVWKESWFVEEQLRCSHYDPLTSGFNRGTDHGWCVLSQQSNPAYTGYDDHAWLDARHKWQRVTAPFCLMGELTTCSGYFGENYYVPHIKQFRSTTATVHNDFVVSDRGEISETETTQFFAGMYSVEIKQNVARTIPFRISTAESVGVFISGYNVFNSGRRPNAVTNFGLQIPEDEWVRLDVVYYTPTVSGRIQFGHNLVDFIDAWRPPAIPDEPAAFYTSFTRKDPGSFAKVSYVLAEVLPPDDETVDQIEFQWRAPGTRPNWVREYLDVSQPSPNVLISGTWIVPHSETIQVRARTINQWGDFSDWLATSGFVSSAGNIKPATTPQPAVQFTADKGIGKYQFDVLAHEDEEWANFILISGYQNDHYIANSFTTVGADVGDTTIQVLGPPSIMTSGMLLTIGGGYAGDSGELHIIKHADSSSAVIELKNPIASSISAPAIVKAYNIAKITRDTSFDLFGQDTGTRYFNLCGQNYNGGISPLAKGSSAWAQVALSVVPSGAIWDEDAQYLVGKNFAKNGGFELPRYISAAFPTYPYAGGVISDTSVAYSDSVFTQNPFPFNNWYSVSGWGALAAVDAARTGRQCIKWDGASVAYQNHYGHHAGLWQDIVNLKWGGKYDASVHLGRDFSTNRLPFAPSGLFGIYYEIWEAPRGALAGYDYSYGSLPAGSLFISSGEALRWVDDGGAWTESTNYPEWLRTQVHVTGPSDGQNNAPIVRVCLFAHPDTVDLHGFSPNNYVMDDFAFTKIDRQETVYDDDLDGGRFNLESIRLNIKAYTNEGDHLDVDRFYGLNVTRRQGNAGPINPYAPTSLAQYTISGHLDYPRLVFWTPNAASLNGSPLGHLSNSAIMNGGAIVVPSGRALMVNIEPNRTFEYNTESEVTIGGVAVSFMVPSGGHQYSGTWYDPGIHSVVQVKELVYDLAGGPSNQVATAWRPIVADSGDLEITNMYLRCYTAFGQPGPSRSPASLVTTYWHAASVQLWETATPFVVSGVNSAGGNNVGYQQRNGLATFDAENTQSVFRGA